MSEEIKQPQPSQLRTSPLEEASTDMLIAELNRRSTGCVIAVMGIDESGDYWRLESKGSMLLVESLFFHLEEKFLPERDEDEGEAVRTRK